MKMNQKTKKKIRRYLQKQRDREKKNCEVIKKPSGSIEPGGFFDDSGSHKIMIRNIRFCICLFRFVFRLDGFLYILRDTQCLV